MWWHGLVWLQLISLAAICLLDLLMPHYTEMLEMWLIPQVKTDVSWKVCGWSTTLHILLSLCTTFWTNIIWVAGLAVVHSHLSCHWPPCSPELTTTDSSVWDIIKEQVTVYHFATVISWPEFWNRHSTPLWHKCFGPSLTEHGGTSGFVLNMMVHKQIHLMYRM